MLDCSMLQLQDSLYPERKPCLLGRLLEAASTEHLSRCEQAGLCGSFAPQSRQLKGKQARALGTKLLAAGMRFGPQRRKRRFLPDKSAGQDLAPTSLLSEISHWPWPPSAGRA